MQRWPGMHAKADTANSIYGHETAPFKACLELGMGASPMTRWSGIINTVAGSVPSGSAGR